MKRSVSKLTQSVDESFFNTFPHFSHVHAVKVTKTVVIVELVEVFKQVHDLILWPRITWSI